MRNIIEIYEIESSTGADLEYQEGSHSITVPVSSRLCVYGACKSLGVFRQHMYLDFLNDNIIAYSIYDGVMEKEKAVNEFLQLCDWNESYDWSVRIHQVNWNMRMAPQLVSIVRGEMLGESLTQMGINATGMLQKLSGVVGAIQVGMFREAWQMLQYQIERDAFLTEERIGKYVRLLQSADMIDYTI